MTEGSEYVAAVVGRIALALEPYDIPTGRSWTAAERREPAERIVRDLGIRLVGYRCDDCGDLIGADVDQPNHHSVWWPVFNIDVDEGAR